MQSIILFSSVLFSFLFSGHEPMAVYSEQSGAVFVTSGDEGRGWLGVSIQDMTPELAKTMNVKTQQGALVNNVIHDSPAEAAGLKDEDIIVEFNGKVITDADDLIAEVRKSEAGAKAEVVVIRNGDRKGLDVTIGSAPRRERPRAFAPRIPAPPRFRMFVTRQALGMTMQELTEQLGEYFGAPDNRGVLITEVEKESAADKAGFKAGDVIVKIGKETVNDIEDIWDEVEEYKEGEKINFEVLRKGATLTLSLNADDLDEHHMLRWRRGPWSMRGGCDGSCLFNWDRNIDFEIEKEIEKEMNRMEPELDRLRIELERLGEEVKNKVQHFLEKTERVKTGVPAGA
jgi:predicted metalloprotease with PDZ domain